LVCLTVRVWCIMSLFLEVKQWIKNSECFIASLRNAKQTNGSLAHSQFLHCDNAPAHTVSEISHKKQNSLVPQPPHSSDPSPADFSFSQNWKLV
jgi:hypothetical protein